MDTLHIFCSYAAKDKQLIEPLRIQMRALDRWNIDVYYVREVLAGTQWKRERDEQINKAHIILLLISADFMAAQEHKYEIQRAIERGEQVRVVPIILRPTAWQETMLGKFTPLPEGGRAVTRWRNQDEAFLNIVTGIKRVIESDKSLRMRAGAVTEKPVEGIAGAERELPPHESRPAKIHQTYQASRDGNKGMASFMLHGTEHTLEYLRRDNVFGKQIFTLQWRQQEVARLEMPFGTFKHLDRQVSFKIDEMDCVLNVKMGAITGIMSVKVMVGGVEVFHNW
jgi:hypothetical protein